MKPRVEFISCEWRGFCIQHNKQANADIAKITEDDPISTSASIEDRLQERADHLIALERLNDRDDAIISDEQMRKLLGIQD